MARHETKTLLRGRKRAKRRPEHLTERRTAPPIVELRRATKVYPGGHVALDRVSLRVDRGEFVFLVGPTGCGKSTLIKLLIRELEPTEGEVLIAGRDIATLGRRAGSRTCAAGSAPSSRTSSCCRAATSTTTSPTRCR